MSLINELRMLAEDLHVSGYNRYSAAMSKAAEKERDALRTENAGLVDDMNLLRDNNTALRARVEEMEKQEPVAWVRKLGLDLPSVVCVTDLKYRPSDIPESSYIPLYLAPGAQAAPSVPEGFALVNATHFLAVLDREDWRTAKNRAELRAMLAAEPAPSVPKDWLRAIDEALVVAHIGVANESDTYEQAKAKLNNLIGFHMDVATDPAVNGGWKLVPIEPTETFYQCFSAYDGTSYSNPFDYDDFVKDWREALAATPEAKP